MAPPALTHLTPRPIPATNSPPSHPPPPSHAPPQPPTPPVSTPPTSLSPAPPFSPTLPRPLPPRRSRPHAFNPSHTGNCSTVNGTSRIPVMPHPLYSPRHTPPAPPGDARI